MFCCTCAICQPICGYATYWALHEVHNCSEDDLSSASPFCYWGIETLFFACYAGVLRRRLVCRMGSTCCCTTGRCWRGAPSASTASRRAPSWSWSPTGLHQPSHNPCRRGRLRCRRPSTSWCAHCLGNILLHISAVALEKCTCCSKISNKRQALRHPVWPRSSTASRPRARG